MDILKAAQALMQKQKKISLEDVAKKAKVSRATMYRYFSNIDLLFTEASLDFQHKSPEEIGKAVQSLPFEERLFYIQDYYNGLAQNNEIGFRRYLSAVLSESIMSKKPLRGARRMESINQALAPFKDQMDDQSYHKLTSVASVLMGIDPLITCKDVCKLNNNETNETLHWALEMILKGMNLKLKAK